MRPKTSAFVSHSYRVDRICGPGWDYRPNAEQISANRQGETGYLGLDATQVLENPFGALQITEREIGILTPQIFLFQLRHGGAVVGIIRLHLEMLVEHQPWPASPSLTRFPNLPIRISFPVPAGSC